MKTKLNMKCDNCGHWNSFKVEKVPLEVDPKFVDEPNIQVFHSTLQTIETRKMFKVWLNNWRRKRVNSNIKKSG